MSIRVIDMMAPVALEGFLQEVSATFPIPVFPGTGSISPFIEAAPHYTGIRLKRTISGTHVTSSDSSWWDTAPDPDELKTYTETITRTYSYTKELSFSRVALLEGMSGDGLVPVGSYPDYWPTETYAEGTGTPFDPDTECVMQLIVEPDESQTLDTATNYKYSPIRQRLSTSAYWVSPSVSGSFPEEVVGEAVVTVSGDTYPGYVVDDPYDLVEWVFLYSPEFTGGYEVGSDPPGWGWVAGADGPGSDGYVGANIDDWIMDISAWTEADWRDLRGTHTLTAVDENGVTRTYEWEIF